MKKSISYWLLREWNTNRPFAQIPQCILIGDQYMVLQPTATAHSLNVKEQTKHVILHLLKKEWKSLQKSKLSLQKRVQITPKEWNFTPKRVKINHPSLPLKNMLSPIQLFQESFTQKRVIFTLSRLKVTL